MRCHIKVYPEATGRPDLDLTDNMPFSSNLNQRWPRQAYYRGWEERNRDTGELKAVITGYLAGNVVMETLPGKLRVEGRRGNCLFGGRSMAASFLHHFLVNNSTCVEWGIKCEWLGPLGFNMSWDSQSWSGPPSLKHLYSNGFSSRSSLPDLETNSRQRRQNAACASWTSRTLHFNSAPFTQTCTCGSPLWPPCFRSNTEGTRL